MTTPPPLLLASTSPYRRDLLSRLGLAFDVAAPGVEESVVAGEAPAQRATRLALTKAEALAATHPDTLVIGADQVAACEGFVLDKPGDATRARAQLARLSGRAAQFYSAVALVHAATGRRWQLLDTTTVHTRRLTPAEIERYVEADRPFDCAGSFRAEGLGICLFERIESGDPTGLIGLPLIALSEALRQAGYALP